MPPRMRAGARSKPHRRTGWKTERMDYSRPRFETLRIQRLIIPRTRQFKARVPDRIVASLGSRNRLGLQVVSSPVTSFPGGRHADAGDVTPLFLPLEEIR